MAEVKEPVVSLPKPHRNIIAKCSARLRPGTKDDKTKVTKTRRRTRQDTSPEPATNYYKQACDAYISRWSTHFHYTPYAPNESTVQAQAFYEHKLAHTTALKPGMKVLDVGCGIGAPAREIARFIGCEIVGVSDSQSHVNRAIELTAQEGLSHLCTFVKVELLNLPFASHSFDAAYAIEATVTAPAHAGLYAEISRVLKPNACFGLSAGVLTPKFDAANSEHIQIRDRIESGNTVNKFDKVDATRAGLTGAGFEISHEEDYAKHWTNTLWFPRWIPTISDDEEALDFPTSSILVPFKPTSQPAPPPTTAVTQSTPHPSHLQRPWYFTLQGDTILASTAEDRRRARRMKPLPRRLVRARLWLLEKLLPHRNKGGHAAVAAMDHRIDGMVHGGVTGVFSPCWWFICRKDRDPLTKSASSLPVNDTNQHAAEGAAATAATAIEDGDLLDELLRR